MLNLIIEHILSNLILVSENKKGIIHKNNKNVHVEYLQNILYNENI